MAVCPWCQVTAEEAFIGKNYYAWCTSTLNPGNSKKGDRTKSGVAYNRCANGQVVEGLGYKDCPFFKKQATRKKR